MAGRVEKLLVAVAALAVATTGALAAPKVVATIKPIHSLVAAVMAGLGVPTLIVKGGASPHTYSLRPSDAGALEAADIVFWTGHGMELFLEDALQGLAAGATIVELSEAPGIELQPVREGGAFEPHADEEEHADGEAEPDMHFWLDPENAKAMVTKIASALSSVDPENAAAYAANADAEKAALATLEVELKASLAPVAAKPFIVFHDAYQYFQNRFGLNVVGSVTVTPDTMPGAQRVSELRAKLNSLGPACIFAEPQFEPAVVATIAEGTGAKTGTLDPEGAALPEGPWLYAELLRGLAASIIACLGKD